MIFIDVYQSKTSNICKTAKPTILISKRDYKEGLLVGSLCRSSLIRFYVSFEIVSGNGSGSLHNIASISLEKGCLLVKS